MLPKLSGESMIGIKRSRRRFRNNSKYDRMGLRSRSTLSNTHPLEESALDVN